MNTERFLKLLRNEKVQEEIKDLYCKLDRERFENSSFQGWKWSIILDEDDEVTYMYGSQGTSRMDVLEGSAIVVATLMDNAEVDTNCLGEIEDVDDYKEFIAYLESEFECEEIEEDEDYEEKKQEYIEENCNWESYYDFNANGYKQIEKESWEAICDVYSYDTITNEIYNTIENLENELEYYNSFEQEAF